MPRSARRLRNRLEAAGQKSLADQFDELVDQARSDLLDELADLDLDLVERLRRLAHAPAAPHPPGELEPIPFVARDERPADGAPARRGRERLRAGRVAFALLAGGQASRLRWDGPKGTFPIGPATDRTLFRILVEQLVRAGRDHAVPPRLAVTTSPTTDAATRACFELNDCFGLPRDRLSFASPAALPALDPEGELLLASPRRLFSCPDGHGGAVQALERVGVLEDWEAQGVTTVCTFQVDNPLLPVVDPDLIGRVEPGVPVATKVIRKREPGERLGTVLRADGRPAVIEYSEIGAHAAERGTDGDLRWPLGSIAVHVFSLRFLREGLRDELPLHVAHRDVPCIDDGGRRVRRPARKFERFVFDLFPHAEDIAVVEADRREYAPLKRYDGPESPDTCRAALERLYRSWYEQAGRTPPEGPLELSPLDALGPEDLR